MTIAWASSHIDEVATRILTRARAPWRVYLAGENIEIRPIPAQVATGRIAEPTLCSTVIAGEALANIYVPAKTLRLVIDRLEPGLGWDRLSTTDRADVLEFLIAEVLTVIEAEAGQSISLQDVEHSGDGIEVANVGFEVIWNEIVLPVAVWLEEAELQSLLGWIAKRPRRRVDGLTATVALRRGFAILTMRDLKRLRVGDAIPIETTADECAAAVVAERHVAPCRLGPDGITLTSPLLSSSPGHLRHFMNTDTTDQEPTEATLDNLPVKLVFDAGRIELPFGELESIGEGHVFPLDRAQADMVDIVAQGRVIGRGEIVIVDGMTAVRVTSLVG